MTNEFLKMSTVILVFCLICLSYNFSLAQPAQTKENIRQIIFSYWNDNFLLEDLIDDFIRKGKDDHVTASFSLTYLKGQKRNYRTCNLVFNILTNKDDNYRADLLTFLFNKTKSLALGHFTYGHGIVGRGNFGGGEIQNRYHDLFGYPRIELPYLSETKIGLVAISEFKYDFIKKTTYYISGNLLVNFVTAAGPSNVMPGFTVGCFNYFNLKLNLGYVNYYKTDKWLKPLFKRGFVWEITASKKVTNSLRIGLWLAKSLYGIKDEFHYGLHFYL